MKDRAGIRYGKLVAIEPCGKAPNNLTIWSCRCDCGRMTESRGDSLSNGQATSCGQGECHPRTGTARALSPRWVGDAIGYGGIHTRLSRDRGPARLHACVDCGDRARDWSYDGLDPDERINVQPGRNLGNPFSAKAEHYVPRCRPCHKAHDLRRAG